jgi:hypothetical protein
MTRPEHHHCPRCNRALSIGEWIENFCEGCESREPLPNPPHKGEGFIGRTRFTDVERSTSSKVAGGQKVATG